MDLKGLAMKKEWQNLRRGRRMGDKFLANSGRIHKKMSRWWEMGVMMMSWQSRGMVVVRTREGKGQKRWGNDSWGWVRWMSCNSSGEWYGVTYGREEEREMWKFRLVIKWPTGHLSGLNMRWTCSMLKPHSYFVSSWIVPFSGLLSEMVLVVENTPMS